MYLTFYHYAELNTWMEELDKCVQKEARVE